MKRFIALLLCTLTVLSLLPLSVLAEGEKPTYTWADDGSACHAEITIDGTKYEEDGTIGAPVVKTAPTCCVKGTNLYTATFLDTEHFTAQTKEIQNIPMDASNHVSLIQHEAKAPTCIADGNNEYFECEACGNVFKPDKTTSTTVAAETIAKTPGVHDLIQHTSVAPTCIADGNNEYWECKDCNALFKPDKTTPTTLEDEIIAKTPDDHDLSYYAAQASTCVTDGNKEHWKCNDCGKYFLDAAGTEETTEEYVTLPKTNHQTEYIEPVYPLCEVDGNIEYWHCTVCGKYFDDATLAHEITLAQTVAPATGHLHITHYEETESTYYEAGHIEYWQCDDCGKYYDDASCAPANEKTEDQIKKPLALLGTPIITLTVENRTTVKLESSAVTDASGYAVFRYVTSEGPTTAVMFPEPMTAERKFTDDTLLAGVSYTYYVKAYIVDGEDYAYSPESNKETATVEPSKAEGVFASANGTTVTVTWNASANATGYDIYYTEDQTLPDASYTLVGSAKSGTATSFQQKDLLPGHIYYYKVRAYTIVDSVKTEGAFSSPAANVTVPLGTPVVTLTKVDAANIKIAWKEVPGATNYIVTASGGKEVKKTVAAPALDITLELPPSGTYTVTVSAYTEVSGDRVSSKDSAAQSMNLSLSAPALIATKKTVTSISLSWAAVSGADKYELYYYDTATGSYTLLSTQAGLSYTHTAAPGRSHYYTVRAVSNKGGEETKSEYSSLKCVSLVFGTPAISSIKKLSPTKIELKWKAVDGATGYRLWRKAKDEMSYTLYKNESVLTASTLTYTDETPAGTTYYYYLQAAYINGTDEVVSKDSGVKNMNLPLGAPAVTAKKVDAKSIKLTWKHIAGATAYRVYVSTEKNGTYSFDGEVTVPNPAAKSYTYVYTNLPGKTYYFRVKAVCQVGSDERTSVLSAIKYVKLAFAAPSLTVKKASSSTVKLTWKSVSGATSYRLYEKEGTDGVFTLLKEIMSTDPEFASRTVVTPNLPGTTYYYKMVAVIEVGGNETTSAYSATRSIKLTFAAPALTLKKTSATDITLTWKAVSMAEKYRVYYKESTDASYTQLGADIDAADPRTAIFAGMPGKKYSFKVVGVKMIGSREAIGAASVKTYTLPFAKPAITVTKDSTNAIIIKWKQVNPATRYVVQVSTSSTFANPDEYDCPTLILQINGYMPAKYYIRVKAVYDNGNETSSSAWSSAKYITLK